MTYSGSQTRVGKYELGRTLGQGTFGKVKHAKNMETGERVAIKVLDKGMIKERKLVEQTKREISTMRLLKHPNIVRLLEVLASKTKIYLVLEFVSGGQISEKIIHQGFLKEDEARKYFQQLINAIDYCHSKGVYHRDLKPSNLLLDERGNLKISDFGFSAIQEKHREDGLLKTKCGTPDYVAPEVINCNGYKGSTADLWSCGVILFVLLAGYQPFHHSNLITLYKKISRADFTCPSYFSAGARMLISQILDPNPGSRITVPQILETEWFQTGYQRAKSIRESEEDGNLVDIHALVNDSSEYLVLETKERQPVTLNAFELISSSRGLDLSGLFKGHPRSASSILISKGPRKSEVQPRAKNSIVVDTGPRTYKGYPCILKGFGSCLKCIVNVYLVCGSKYGKDPKLQRVDSLAY